MCHQIYPAMTFSHLVILKSDSDDDTASMQHLCQLHLILLLLEDLHEMRCFACANQTWSAMMNAHPSAGIANNTARMQHFCQLLLVLLQLDQLCRKQCPVVRVATACSIAKGSANIVTAATAKAAGPTSSPSTVANFQCRNSQGCNPSSCTQNNCKLPKL